ncbi:MAG: hypothetical protein ACW98X_16910 [Promethearchaeota archaeon]|jgi:hypothetical protein
MSFLDEYSKDLFKQDLEKGRSFIFKGKKWISLIIWLINIILIPLGIYYVVILTPLSPSYAIITGISFLFIIIMGLYSGIKSFKRKIEITPEGINWKGGFSSGYINFIDIEDISFYPSAFLGFHIVKFFLSNKRIIKLRTSNMTKPKNWYSEEMIRTIIDNYWTKANPEAKYATESVTSKPSTKPKSISLIKPNTNSKHTEATQGYKCPNCLFIHNKEYKFCPKCGAEM